MLNCVPCNKNLWGGGCHFREETIGSLEFGKEVVCEVLAKKNRTGQLKEEQARLMIPSIFHGNAVKLFNLK